MQRRPQGCRATVWIEDVDGEPTSGWCLYCGVRKATEVDHVIPWSWHKDNHFLNLVPACKRCNGMLSDSIFPTLEAKRWAAYDMLRRKNATCERPDRIQLRFEIPAR